MPLFQSLNCALKSLPFLTSRLNWFIFGTAPLEPTQKASFQCLPNELLLEIFSFLELKPYIICHGVCKKWRHLLPLADMDPTRRRLLDLYHLILDTPNFQKAFKWTDQNLHPFDREAYIDCLLTQYPVIPEEFRMWILEWPARLAIRSIWPGLPFISCRTLACHRHYGVNWIAYRPTSPQLSSLVYRHDTPFQAFIPGLFIWATSDTTVWLIFDQDQPQLFGKVFSMHTQEFQAGTIPRYPPRGDSNDEDSEDSGDEDNEREYSDDDDGEDSDDEYYDTDFLFTYEDWICYLESHWNRQISYSRNEHIGKDYRVAQPVRYNFDNSEITLPAPPWDSCQRTIDRIYTPYVWAEPINWHPVDDVITYTGGPNLPEFP